jgi:hypothetical protein
MAVAESPTPSLELQRKAVQIVLPQLTAGDDASTLPVVFLLRKVSGRLERELCDALGARLDNGGSASEASAAAGPAERALATAGTAAATETLSKYPSAWRYCLHGANYLSNTFEKLLFTWVEIPSHAYSQPAADLLLSRHNEETISQLIDILEKLASEKANFLASAVLKKMDKWTIERYAYAVSLNTIETASRCIPYVEDTNRLLR